MDTKQVLLIIAVIIGLLIVIPLIPKAIRELKGPDPEVDQRNLVVIERAIKEFVKVRGQNPETLDALAPMYIAHGIVPRTADGQSFLYDPYTAAVSIPKALPKNIITIGGGGSGMSPMGDAMTGMSVADEMNY